MISPTNHTDAADKWSIEIVEKGPVGEFTSHVLDSKGNAHIAYFDYNTGNLKHAVNGPDGWRIETVDKEGTVGEYLSIAKDEEEKIYISYRDQGQNRLKMAVFNGSTWNIEVVDAEPFASFDTSIFVDAHGKVYISYYNFSRGCLKLAIRNNNQWEIEEVDVDPNPLKVGLGGFSSLKVDSHGRIHISYTDSVNGLLKYAVKQSDGWNIEIADGCEFVGSFTSLALDTEGNPYISYTVDKAPNKPDLWLATNIGGKWMNELVDTANVAGNYSSILVDRNSNVFISYSAMAKLKMAKYIMGAWDFEIVDPGGTVTHTSLSFDRGGMSHIAYHDKERGVKYAHKVSGV